MGKRAEQGLGRLLVVLGGVVVGFLGGVFTFALLLATDAPAPEEEMPNPYAEEDRANLAAMSDLQISGPIVLDRTLVVERGPTFDSANFSALTEALQAHPQVDHVSYSAEEGANLLFKAALLDSTKVDAAALSALLAPLDCKVVEVR
ncbi:MAG: hypothetical protein CO108_07700 [Deltaproteobacteria bacterium CG_4_9_14_3_um_filter_63_12]|nr:MAG: hypothetical protein CO108_07700 [Deltaproteobacteria bacterium CG_4_9_14_3_um_filter_63_12]